MALDDKFKIKISPTFEFNNETIKTNLQNAIKEVGKGINPIELIGKLDIENTRININNSLSKLNLDKIKLDFDLNLENLQKQMSNLNVNNENIRDKIKIPENNQLSLKSSNLISSNNKILENGSQVITQIYRKNSLELEKYILTLDKEGKKIDSVTEYIKDYEKVQKTLYSELESKEKKLSKLYSDKNNAIKNGKKQTDEYDKLIKKQKESIRFLEMEIKTLGLKDSSLESKNQNNINNTNLKTQLQMYKELEKQEKVLYDLRQKAKISGADNLKNLYNNESIKQERIVASIREEIKARGLVNEALDKSIERLLRIKEEQDKNKELTRQTKIGNLVDTESAKKLSYDSNTLDLEEFGKSLNTDTEKFERITGLKNKIQDVNNAQKQFTVSMKSGRGYVTEYTYAIDKASGKVFELGNRTRRVNTTIAGFGSMFGEMAEKVLQWNFATTAVYKTMEFFQRGIKFIIELDTALTSVALVTGQTRSEVEGLKDEYLALADATKKTVTEISNLNVELTRQGLSKEQASERLDTVLKLSAVGGIDVADTLQIVTSSVNALGEEAQKTADILVYADNNSASSVQKIGIAIQKVASTAKTSGLTIEQLVGQISTLIDVTQEAPETLGNSLKSIMARFSKVNELGEINEDINDVEKAFRQVGIAFKDSEGQIRPFYDLMGDMAKEWKNLDKNTQAMVATLAAGTMQQNRFLVLMQNWDRVQEMTSKLESNSGGSLDRGYSTWTKSLQADINELKIAFEELWITMFEEDALSNIINFITMIINSINGLAKAINITLFALIALSIHFANAEVKISRFLYNGLKKGIVELKNFGNSLKSVTKDTKGNTKAIIENIKALKNKNKANKETGKSTKQVGSDVSTATSKFSKFKNALANTKLGSFALTVGLSLLSTAIFQIGASIVGVVKKIVSDLNPSFEKVKEKSEEITNNFKDLNETHHSNINTLKEVKDEFEKFNSIVGESNDLTKLSTEEKQRYLEICSQISSMFPEYISYWDSENNAVLQYGINLDTVIEKEKELYNIKKNRLKAEFYDNAKNFDKAFLKTENDNFLIDREIQDILRNGIDKGTDLASKIDRLFDKYINVPIANFFNSNLYNFGLFGSTNKDFFEKQEQADIYRNKLRDIINNPNSTPDEIANARIELEKTNKIIDQLIAKKEANNASNNEFIQQSKQILSLELSDYYEELGDSISTVDKNLISKYANENLEALINNPNYERKGYETTDALVMAERMKETIDKFNNEILFDETPIDLSDNVNELKELEESLITLGMDKGSAKNFINELAFGIDGIGKTAELSTSKINLLAKEVSGSFTKMNTWQDLYKKTFDGSLSFSDISSLSETDPDVYLEFLNKVNEGKETEIALREVILAQIEKINAETNKNIELAIEENDEKKKILLEQEKLIKSNLSALEKKGDIETSQYRELQKELEIVQEDIKTIDEDTQKFGGSLNATKKLFEEFSSKNQLDSFDDQFKKATENISTYESILETLNKEGMSGSLYKDILLNYPNLISYIDDEIALRNALNNLIAEEKNLQKEAYKAKMMYNEQFYKSFLENNKDLVQKLSNLYGLDLQNFKTFSELKEQVAKKSSANMLNYQKQMLEGIRVEYANFNSSQNQAELNKVQQQIQNIENGVRPISPQQNTLLEELKLRENELKNNAPLLEAIDSIDINLDKLNNSVSSVGSGTSSSSSSKKSIIDLIELEKEEYLKLNKELEKNNRLREKNSKLLNYAYGSDKIDLINKENELLTERQKLDNQLANKYREEQAKLKTELSKVINMNTGDEGMDNFTSYMKKKENEINSLIKQINATTNQTTVDSLTEKKDKLEKEVNKFAEQYKKYIEITFNTIPDLQDDYMEAVFKKFDNMVEMMSVQLDKYEREISRLNVLKDLTITGKNDNTSELKRELAIHEEISKIYLNQLNITEKKVKETQQNVDVLQNKLNSIKDKSSSDYNNTYTSLITAKNILDESLKLYESNLNAYSDSISSKVNIEIQLINKLKDSTKESLQDLRKEINEFTFDNFNNSLKEIELSLNKLDDIFIDNPSFVLDTTDTRKNIKNVENTIDSIRKNTDKWKKSLEEVKKSNKSNKEIIENIKTISEELIKVENALNETISLKNKEIEKLKLEYQAIEDSLQNQIDLKNEELERIQEEFEYEQKVNSLIEKRLNLLNALDDTSHMYVTGQGTVEWTYDKYAVDDLLKQISEQDKQDKQNKIVQEMQEEIDKMVENLEKTKEIHQQNLAVNQAQLEQLEQEKNYIGNILEDNFESLDESFNKMIDQYINTINNQFEKNTGTLIDIYNLLKENVGSNNFNYRSISNSSQEIVVGKNEETLDKIANKYNTTVENLLELNTSLNKNSILNFGQKIKIPAFDTGGYTGSFGDEGKLAILHQKELVLNQNDTKNLLSIVNLVRDIISNSINNIIPSNSKNKEKNTVININNISLPNVQNSNQFINELQRFARGGMGSLS